MIRFANESYAWLLLLVPVFAVVVVARYQVKNRWLRRFIDDSVIAFVQPDYPRRAQRELVEGIIVIGVLLFLVLGVLRPQWGFAWKEAKRKGIDIVLAVDVSESMMANDVSPNRLERARRKIQDLLTHLRGDRVALVAFAGTSFLEVPLTYDYAAFRSFLSLLEPGLIPIPGTNVESALKLAIDALVGSKQEGVTPAAPFRRARAIVLITDGEEFEGGMGNIKQLAADNDVKIFIVGIGSEEGSPVPAPKGGYKKDKQGNIVITKLRPAALRELAINTGGVYVQSVASDKDIQAIYEMGLKRALTDEEFGSGREKRWNEYFQVPLAAAVLFLIWYSGGFASIAQIWRARSAS